jgi:hypothetical protein
VLNGDTGLCGEQGQAQGSAMHQRSQVEALNVRALQTELMLGALACGERERYNAFIQARQPELVH